MLSLYACLTEQHDLRLVPVAGLVCLLASWTALNLARRSIEGRGRSRLAWLSAAAVVAGCGIWATHFIAILAFATGMPTAYDPVLTACSVAVAVSGAEAAFTIAAGQRQGGAWLGGAIFGLAIGAMHYSGMAAVRLPAFMSWDPGLVATSLLLGAGLGAAAFRIALRGTGLVRITGGALLLTLGICATHFAGMGALRLEPTPLLPVPESGVSSVWLALGVAAASAVILIAGAVGMVFDQHLVRRSSREAERLRALVDATFEGILIQADGIALDLNESLAALLGYERNALIGRPVHELLMQDPPRMQRNETNASQALESECLRSDGARVPVEILGRPIEYDGRPARVIAVRDVTERRASEARIHRLAYHDALTELPNRVLFREHLQRALGRVQRGNNLAVLSLDLDRFKVVNDTLGHQVGDGLLRAAAQRLLGCVRKADLVARLGGDEFAIVQEEAAQPTEATALCRRLVQALSLPFEIDGHQVVVGVSIGVMLATAEGCLDADTLLKSADLALYRAKNDGRGTWRFFEAEMDAQMQARRMLELDLRQALAKGQLAVHYQPLVSTGGGRVSGLEALLRWSHPERGMVSPALFIPLAEEIGLIGTIGAWVLRRACADAAGWPGEPRIAINLSPAQFRDNKLAGQVAAALADAGLPASRLELEVTESLLLGDDAEILGMLHELRRLGVRIAMDDFGTGYSSLSYLRRFPFDKIKIDQSFVRGLAKQEDCTAIIRAVVGLGRSLGMAVNAEGVETAGQLALLRAEGCAEVQGYLFSEAQPAYEIAHLLQIQADGGTQAWDLDQGHEDAVDTVVRAA
jgi:diguanylate cyclase (GGDEF)-like protein/PAS domain S-box-containing protein